MSIPNRRASDIGVLKRLQGNGEDALPTQPDRARRKSIAVGALRNENKTQLEKPKAATPQETESHIKQREKVPGTPGTSRKHFHHRTNLGSASSYYFANLPKTPVDKVASARKRLHASMQMQDVSFSSNFDLTTGLAEYNGTPAALETSYMSNSSSGSSSAADLLNASVSSDVTEYVASTWVVSRSARQRFSLSDYQREINKNAQKEDQGRNSRRRSSLLPPTNVIDQKRDPNLSLGAVGTLDQSNSHSVSKPSLQRRDSWRENNSPGKKSGQALLQLMKQRRLSKQSVGSRLSVGSNLSQNEEVPPSNINLTSEEKPREVGSVPGNPTTLPKDDDSVVSAGSLFEGLLSVGEADGIKGEATATDSENFTLRPSVMTEVLNASVSPLNMSISASTKADRLSQTLALPLESSINKCDDSLVDGDPFFSTENPVGSQSPGSQVATAVGQPPSRSGKSPRPLPESVAFESENEPSSSQKSPLPKRVGSERASPKKVMKSPRKENPSLVDSPARNTRSQKRLSSMEKKRKIEESLDIIENISIPEADKRRKSSLSTSLVSSLRRASSRKQDSARKVAFGSPEFAEFNTNSPSMSMTPLPKSAATQRLSLFDNTLEIERDMNALIANIDNPEAVAKLAANGTSDSTAGGTPFAIRRKRESEFEDATRELEPTLQDMLEQENETKYDGDGENDSRSDMSDGSQEGNLAGEHTMTLETNMVQLLANSSGESQEVDEKEDTEDFATEEGHTVELEFSMGDVLAAADSPKQSPEIEIEMAEETTPIAGQLRRRSSAASRRFSLAPKSRLSLEESCPNETDISENVADVLIPQEERVLDLEVNQVLSIAKRHSFSGSQLCDIFVDMNGFIEKNSLPEMAEVVTTFLIEVCDNFEAVIPLDNVSEFFEQQAATDRDKLLLLQKRLQSDSADITKQRLVSLWEASVQFDITVVKKWLLETAYQMKDYAMNGSFHEIETEIQCVNEKIENLDDAECFLSSVKSRAIQKARRKSLDRRRSCASSIEKEISQLEEEIRNMSTMLEANTQRLNDTNSMLAAVEKRDRLRKSDEALHADASSNSRKWTTLKTLIAWQTQLCSPFSVALVYIGQCPASTVSISFEQTGTGSVVCSAHIDPTLYPKNKARNTDKFKSVMEFLKIRIQHACDKMSSYNLKSMTETGGFLRRFIWELNRVESTANEIGKLQRRYDASLSMFPVPGLDLPQFTLAAGFEDATAATSQKRVVASFEISESYPYGPMQVHLDAVPGDIDIVGLQENVAKTAKPGFGYLARTLNAIATLFSESSL